MDIDDIAVGVETDRCLAAIGAGTSGETEYIAGSGGSALLRIDAVVKRRRLSRVCCGCVGVRTGTQCIGERTTYRAAVNTVAERYVQKVCDDIGAGVLECVDERVALVDRQLIE